MARCRSDNVFVDGDVCERTKDVVGDPAAACSPRRTNITDGRSVGRPGRQAGRRSVEDDRGGLESRDGDRADVSVMQSLKTLTTRTVKGLTEIRGYGTPP